MQDMLAQIALNDAVLSPVQPLPAPVKYAFEERAHIPQAFFDPPPSAKRDGNLDRQITIVDDLVSLCTRRERRPRKPRQSWEDDTATSSSDDTTDVEIKSECSDSEVPLGSHSNDSTPSAASTRCSATLTGIIGFNLARTAHSRMMNVRNSHSKASCTLRITQRGSMESSCLINARIHYSLLQWIV